MAIICIYIMIFLFIQSSQYFLFDYTKVSLNPVTLWTTPDLQKAITIHPVKKPANMLSLHHFYKALEFKHDYEAIHAMAEYLNRLCSQLPPHTSPSLSLSPGCNLKLHPHLAYFNTSKLNHQGLAPSGFLVHRNHIPFYLRPVDKFDLQPWTRFNKSLVQEVTGSSPEHSYQGSLKAEVLHILSMLKSYIKTEHAPNGITITRILDGYIRFNPHLGREYILDLKFTVSNTPKPVYQKYHVLREIGPQISVVDKEVTSSSVVIHTVLPLRQVDSSFSGFLKSYSHIGLRHSENKLRLIVVVFSEHNAELTKKALREFTIDTFPAAVSIVLAKGAFNNLVAIDRGMEAIVNPSSLVFIADVKVRFGPGFFRRCRSNTVMGETVYFPIVFWLYSNNYSKFKDGSVPSIVPWKGKWITHDFCMLCIYKQDYDAVGGYKNKKYSSELFEALVSSHFDVMQAPDPGLFRTWSVKRCSNLNSWRRSICQDMKKRLHYEEADLTDYLAELDSRRKSSQWDV